MSQATTVRVPLEKPFLVCNSLKISETIGKVLTEQKYPLFTNMVARL